MIEKFSEQTTCRYRSNEKGGLIAVVVMTDTKDSHETTITVSDELDYDYVQHTFYAPLSEELKIKYAEQALKQASDMRHPPSKYGEEPAKIDLTGL